MTPGQRIEFFLNLYNDSALIGFAPIKKRMKRIIVFYHKDCPDGFGAAWAAWKKFGRRADYIGIDPRSVRVPRLSNKEVYFLDAAFDPRNASRIQDLVRRNRKVVLIDHHITREPSLSLYSDFSFHLARSGAGLAWEYFHGRRRVPRLLRHIEDQDLWRFKLPFTKELMAGLEMYGFDFKRWNRIADDFKNRRKIRKYLEEGRTILKYQQALVRRLMNDARGVSLGGHRALVVNSPVFASKIGDYIIKIPKAKIGIIWSLQKDGNVRVSLRSKKPLDVSRIAQKYGGGGHPRAAGFLWDVKKGFPWESIK